MYVGESSVENSADLILLLSPVSLFVAGLLHVHEASPVIFNYMYTLVPAI